MGEYDTDTDVDCLEVSNRRECADPAVDVPVEERIAHEDYNAQDLNQYNDIALLRLARDVQFTGNWSFTAGFKSFSVKNKIFVFTVQTVLIGL